MSTPAEAAGDFAARYAAALRAYLEAEEPESALAEAYARGRDAVETGLSLLDLACVHEQALRPLLGRAAEPAERARMSAGGSAFLQESLAPFEMVHRGFREANAGLQEANAALARSSERLAETLDSLEAERETLAHLSGLSDGVILIGRDNTIRYCNARAGELVGVDNELLVGKSAEALPALLGETPPALAAWPGETLEPSSLELCRDGPPARDLLVQTFAAAAATGAGLGLVLRDVTAERELARAKDELVSIVSHELRSPLTAIVGFAKLSLDERLGAGTRMSYLETISDEAQRLAALVDDFLDVQRLEERRIDLRCQPVALPELVARARKALGEQPAHPLVLDLPAALPELWADPERLLQVLVNLLSNAVKYSPSGGELRVAARTRAGQVEICVADVGLGILPDALPHLFEKFYRAESAERALIRGTGLGLSICRQLVEAHGGAIWAESDGLGRGARFYLTMPTAAEARIAAGGRLPQTVRTGP